MPPDPATVARLASATDQQLTDEFLATTRAVGKLAHFGRSPTAALAHLDLIHAEKARRKDAK